MKRVIKLVILNATIGLLLKALSLYGPIYDADRITYLLNHDFKSRFRSANSYINVGCYYGQTCHTVEQMAKLLYMISLIILIIFYLNFDKNFYQAFKTTLSRRQQSTKENFEMKVLNRWHFESANCDRFMRKRVFLDAFQTKVFSFLYFFVIVEWFIIRVFYFNGLLLLLVYS